MGLKPVKIFVKTTGGYITREESVNSPITVVSGESLIIAYDKSEFTFYGKLINPKIIFSVSRVPQCDAWSIYYTNYPFAGPISVGTQIAFPQSSASGEYTGKNGWHPEYDGTYAYNREPIVASEDYVYFYAYASAYDITGTQGRPSSDQTFTISNFDLTFTESTQYSFVVVSDFNGGYKNPRKTNSFKLSPVYHADMIPQYVMESAVLYYKKTDVSEYTAVPFTGTTVTLPAGTLAENSNYNVYFTAESADGFSFTTAVFDLTTIDGVAVVTSVSPHDEVTHGEITFVWNYSNTTGEPQYAFDLQISPDNAEWETVLSHVVTSDTSVVFNQTLAGDSYWRVRGYNQDDVAGDWSSSLNYLNSVPPQPPVISEIIPGGRIQVRWSAVRQASYRIRVIDDNTTKLIYDSGDMYGTESLVLVNTYLPNGTYTVQVKISNIYGKESAWSTASYTQTEELPELQYTAGYTNNGVSISVASTGFDTYYLLRNNVLIAQFNTPSYTDMFASGETTYRLIAVDSNDNFAQAVFTINAAVPSARLITLDGQVLEVSERWDNFNNAEQSEEIRFSANEYLGASTPEHLFSKMRVKRFTRAFYDPDRIARQLLGTVAFYADEYGNSDWVAITSYTRADSWLGDDTKIEMEVTTRKEEVTYAV